MLPLEIERAPVLRLQWLKFFLPALGFLVLAGNVFAATSAQSAAAGTSALAQEKAGAPECSAQSSDRSGCAIRFSMPPPKIVIQTRSVVIGGAHMPVSVKKYMLKNALHRPWSVDPKDRYLVVCRTESKPDTRIPYSQLNCETNATHIQLRGASRQDFGTHFQGSVGCSSSPQVHTGKVSIPTIEASCIMAEVVAWAHAQGASRVLIGMSKLPPAGGSHTFIVKNRGKVVSKWIFEKGRLVGVWHPPDNTQDGNSHGN